MGDPRTAQTLIQLRRLIYFLKVTTCYKPLNLKSEHPYFCLNKTLLYISYD